MEPNPPQTSDPRPYGTFKLLEGVYEHLRLLPTDTEYPYDYMSFHDIVAYKSPAGKPGIFFVGEYVYEKIADDLRINSGLSPHLEEVAQAEALEKIIFYRTTFGVGDLNVYSKVKVFAVIPNHWEEEFEETEFERKVWSIFNQVSIASGFAEHTFVLTQKNLEKVAASTVEYNMLQTYYSNLDSTYFQLPR